MSSLIKTTHLLHIDEPVEAHPHIPYQVVRIADPECVVWIGKGTTWKYTEGVWQVMQRSVWKRTTQPRYETIYQELINNTETK